MTNELLSAAGANMSFYRSNKESIQNNQGCQTLQFLDNNFSENLKEEKTK
jgi:hypothetical protein